MALALDEERERAEPVAAVTGSVSGTVVGTALGSADGCAVGSRGLVVASGLAVRTGLGDGLVATGW
jgi:hypothetical protein